MNNSIVKTAKTLEGHCIQLPYASLRVHQRGLLERLTRSMEQHGQLMPVVVVPKDANQWVLMDGYLRMKALQRLGKDTVDAEVWMCDVAEALLMLLTEHQSRPWEAFEEALLLQELHTQHGFSQHSLACRIGRDQSWVSRRLALVEHLPESILQSLVRGKISLWSATRVLAPMARAIPEHAELLLQHLTNHAFSTRELHCFYEHYQQSNRQERLRMVTEPNLFFKAQTLLATEKQTTALQAGPEGQWCSQLHLVMKITTQLKRLAPSVLTAYQDTHEREALMSVLNEAAAQFTVLTETVRNLHAH